MTGIQPLRGRALVQRHPEELGEYQLPSGIIIPGTVGSDPRKFRIHRGKILALGKPAFEYECKGIERPWDCNVGDEIYFVFSIALEKVRAFENMAFVAQEEILCVTEIPSERTTDPAPSSFRPGFDDDVADPFHGFENDDGAD
jgi:co-chaperonin GroES (HSP10)